MTDEESRPLADKVTLKHKVQHDRDTSQMIEGFTEIRRNNTRYWKIVGTAIFIFHLAFYVFLGSITTIAYLASDPMDKNILTEADGMMTLWFRVVIVLSWFNVILNTTMLVLISVYGKGMIPTGTRAKKMIRIIKNGLLRMSMCVLGNNPFRTNWCVSAC